MPPQSRALVLPSLLRAAVPGAINLTADQLDGSFIVSIDGQGVIGQQTTLAQLQAYFASAALTVPARVVTVAPVAVLATDTTLLIDLAAPAPVTIPLPTPALGRVLIIKDMAGNAGSDAITLDAGAGKLINGQQTLVMNANFETTMLIGMSTTAWGTLI